MKKRILNYLQQIDALLEQPPENPDWEEILNEHLEQVEMFQHERLIHLIVTVLFAIMTTNAMIGMVLSPHVSLVILLILFLILLFPYICHYYLLENGVQKMYDQYDRMVEFKHASKDASKDE